MHTTTQNGYKGTKIKARTQYARAKIYKMYPKIYEMFPNYGQYRKKRDGARTCSASWLITDS